MVAEPAKRHTTAASLANADIRAHHIRRRDHGPASDDEIERHDGSLRRSADGRNEASNTSSGFGVSLKP